MELTRENISLYCQIGTMLDDICEKYFDKVADDSWQFYSDWGVYDDKTIRLYYYYCDYNEYIGKETTEMGHIEVKIDDLIEFSKKLKMHVEYEDNEIQIISEYDPAQHIYDNDEINLWKINQVKSDYGKEI